MHNAHDLKANENACTPGHAVDAVKHAAALRAPISCAKCKTNGLLLYNYALTLESYHHISSTKSKFIIDAFELSAQNFARWCTRPFSTPIVNKRPNPRITRFGTAALGRQTR